jgi:vitamin B12 transporter
MSEMVITATKIEEPKKEVPASIQVIGSEDIKNSTARDAGDLIAEAGVGHITNYGGAYTSTVEIRGLTTDGNLDPLMSRVLVLINGNRAGTVNFATIPVDDIERIEIVKGPASVLYGSSAMGGVINIITKQGKREGFHGSVGGEAGTFGYWKAGAEMSVKKDRLDYYITADRSERGDYSAPGYGTIENSGYKKETISTRLGYRLFNDHHVSLGFQHMDNWDVGSQGATYSPDPDDYNSKKRDGFDIAYKTPTFNGAYYLVKERGVWYMTPNFGSGPGNSAVWKSDTDTQGVNLQKTFPIGNHRIIVGAQWDRIEAKSRNNEGPPYSPDGQYNTYGGFSEARLSFLNKKLLLSGGLRYDAFENKTPATPGITSLVTKTERLDHWTARGGIVFAPNEALSFKANLGTAFRAPSPQELAIDYLYYGTHYVGNPNLKPETSTTGDVGIYYTKGAFKSDLTLFHTDFKDKIVEYYDTTQAIETYKNVNGAILQGFEFNASCDVGAVLGWRVIVEPFTNITYKTKYVQKNEGGRDTTLAQIPKWTGAFGIKVGQKNWDARLIANYTGWSKVTSWDSSSTTYGQTVHKAGFTVVSLKGAYRPIKHLELTASVDNLFDKGYSYNLGYPMPGRSFTGGVRWIF